MSSLSPPPVRESISAFYNPPSSLQPPPSIPSPLPIPKIQKTDASNPLPLPMSKRPSSPPPPPNPTKKPMSSPSTLLPASAFLVQRLSSKAKIPTRGSSGAAGYDLYAYVPSSLVLVYSTRMGGRVWNNVTRRRGRATREPTTNPPPPSLLPIRSAESKLIPARGKGLINTELSISVPSGTYGRIAPRSGLGSSPPLLPLLCFVLMRAAGEGSEQVYDRYWSGSYR